MVAVVNALGYGIIFPILYSYTQRFGLSDFGNGLLFASFSICQFISTPIIGRLSDKYGRKPLLLISLAGTVLSFGLMAIANSVVWLFIARMLDGITAGNLPVAQAVISDSTVAEDRAKGFGMIGASFSFGFIFGPMISALTSGYSPATPFWIAGAIALAAVVLTAWLLPETNKHIGEVKRGKLIDLPKMWHTLFDPNVGTTFVISFLSFFAFSLFIYAFQPFSVKVLYLNVEHIAMIFVALGIVGLITQTLIVPRITKRFGLKRTFTWANLGVAIAFVLAFFSQSYLMFIVAMALLSVANGHVQPLINAILSRETDEKSQGSIMGLNVAYGSIGQILGPITGGAVATIAVRYPFLAAAAVTMVCYILSFQILKSGIRKESAF